MWISRKNIMVHHANNQANAFLISFFFIFICIMFLHKKRHQTCLPTNIFNTNRIWIQELIANNELMFISLVEPANVYISLIFSS